MLGFAISTYTDNASKTEIPSINWGFDLLPLNPTYGTLQCGEVRKPRQRVGKYQILCVHIFSGFTITFHPNRRKNAERKITINPKITVRLSHGAGLF